MPNTDTSPQILCVGRIYCDLVFSGVSRMPSLGSEVFAENVTLHAGGGAFNTASAFSALGRRTALCGVLPAAPFQDQILREGRSMDLDLSLCVPASIDASPQITVAIALQGDRSFLSQKSGAAFPCPDLSAPVCRSVKHLHIGELNSLCEIPEILDLAGQAGWTVSLDCSWDDALLRQGRRISELIRAVDVFLPNQQEFEALEASGLTPESGPLIVVKKGAAGAAAYQGQRQVHVAAQEVEVVDATGAGDAFNGGFLSAWLANEKLASCLENGNRYGALAVQSSGGAGWTRENGFVP